ncbi:hypothetical protein GCM10023144_44350 [Pigmentiphaga soli]|uniref:Flagellar protein FliT n=1 Tax=Pigmentiphaga soli TaxID=1007095 RepID=A0ABP8HPU4_9BURK
MPAPQATASDRPPPGLHPEPAAFDPSSAAGASLREIYTQFAQISSAMLEAARRGDWNDVTLRERACAQLIEILRNREPLRPSDEAERQACMQLLRKVLADDAAIRDLAEPWLRELDQILHPGRRRLPVHTFR